MSTVEVLQAYNYNIKASLVINAPVSVPPSTKYTIILVDEHVHEGSEGLSSINVGESHPVSAQRALSTHKIAKGRATEVPSLENYRIHGALVQFDCYQHRYE